MSRDRALNLPVNVAECPLGILADDLTGACDSAAVFAIHGLRTIVLIDPAGAPEIDADLIAISTRSRADLPETARRKTIQAACELDSRGVSLMFKKIDSTLRGNVGWEIRAALEATGASLAVVTPAFPAAGRTLIDGRLRLRGAPAGIRLDALLTNQGLPAQRHVPLSIVRSGPDAVRKAMAALSNTSAVVVDAETDPDLSAIASAALCLSRRPLLAGSAGLARAMARALTQSPHCTAPVLPTRPGPDASAERDHCIVFIGSRNPVTARQSAHLRAAGAAVVRLDARFAHKTARHRRAGRHAVVPVNWRDDERQSFTRFAAELGSNRPAGLVLTGGDTAARVCDALGVKAIGVMGEVQPGIPWGILIGGAADGMAVCTKAGGFGTDDALRVATDFLMGGAR